MNKYLKETKEEIAFSVGTVLSHSFSISYSTKYPRINNNFFCLHYIRFELSFSKFCITKKQTLFVIIYFEKLQRKIFGAIV